MLGTSGACQGAQTPLGVKWAGKGPGEQLGPFWHVRGSERAAAVSRQPVPASRTHPAAWRAGSRPGAHKEDLGAR